MKRILILTGIYPPDMGGPANYAKQLNKELQSLGHKTTVQTFRFEKKLPTGLRHLWFFFKILPHVLRSDVVILLDTFSVALPGVLAAKLCGKKTILRTGGDFLWEAYVERTKQKVLLGEFYPLPKDITGKEKIVAAVQRYVLQQTTVVVFSTAFQRDIFIRGYDVALEKTQIIENFYGEKLGSVTPTKMNFLWAGRRIVFKNLDVLREAMVIAQASNPDIHLELCEQLSREELLDKMKSCYAVIYPSLTEISPNQILESIMCNKPFIVTRDVGFYHRIQEIGMFVDPRSVHGVAERILKLAQPTTYEEMKSKVEGFTYTHSYRQIAEEFEAIIDGFE